MKIYIYPSDQTGCGYYRAIWPAERLMAQGHDVTVVYPNKRHDIVAEFDRRTGEVIDARCPADADVLVFGRVTHPKLAAAIPIWRRKGIAVVVDVDDDLSSIHPANPVFEQLRPSPGNDHSWQTLQHACRDATLVTVSSHALTTRYGLPGRARLLSNYLPDGFYGLRRTDSTTVCWPASVDTHPDDARAFGPALNRISTVFPGVQFLGLGPTEEQQRAAGNDEPQDYVQRCRKTFRLTRDPELWPPVSIYEWPQRLTEVGIGLAPLSETRFNRAKSWLKPLEMSAIGVPWVASPRVEYQRFVKEAGAGILAEKPADWYRELKRLITDEDWRLEQAARLRSAALNFKIRDHAWRWLEVWEEAAMLERRPSRAATVSALPEGAVAGRPSVLPAHSLPR